MRLRYEEHLKTNSVTLSFKFFLNEDKHPGMLLIPMYNILQIFNAGRKMSTKKNFFQRVRINSSFICYILSCIYKFYAV